MNMRLGPFSELQPPFIPYDSGFTQMGQLPRTQTPVNYKPPNTVMNNPFCAVGSNPSSGDAPYLYWPNPVRMYAHSYDHFRNAVYQARARLFPENCVILLYYYCLVLTLPYNVTCRPNFISNRLVLVIPKTSTREDREVPCNILLGRLKTFC